MSQENVEIVRRVVALANRAADAEPGPDDDELLGLFHPDVELAPRLTAQLEGKRYRRHAGVREYFADLRESWASFKWEVERYIDHADHVVVFCRFQAVGRGSGVAAEANVTLVCTLDGGKVRQAVTYLKRDEALEAVGLRE